MRGENDVQSGMFSYFSPEQRVPAQHPLRAIKAHTDAALAELSPIFDSMYSKMGRPSIPPERLLKSQLLIALYSVRSETQFCEQVDYNILQRDALQPASHGTKLGILSQVGCDDL